NFGLALNAAEFGSVITIVVAAVGMTFVLSLISGMLMAKLHGMGPREGLNTAAIFVNRGEFTLILATLSVTAGLDQRLQPFAGLYVLTMAILGPIFAANSEKIGAALRRHQNAVPTRKRAHDVMLAEEIALVEAATAAGTGTDAQRAADRLLADQRQRPARSAVPAVVPADARPAAGTAADEPVSAGRDAMLDFISDRIPVETGPVDKPADKQVDKPVSKPADKPVRDTASGDYS
ncbi:MAG TPA: hypothetical protein VLO00_09130, partial [Cryobacterium sp.]|nr:hypothetical protein [Cryobacterium sp.]